MTGDGEKAPMALVIDDDRGIRSLLSAGLSEAGWTVVEASNGFSGLRHADQERPDVILLDLALPEIDGLAVLAELRRRPATRTVPVVAVTGHPERLVERPGSVNALLSKPFDLDHAVGLVTRVWFATRQPASPVPPATTRLHDRPGPATPRTVGPTLGDRA